MFTNEQLAELTAPLDRTHVRERSQSGRALSYIEGWHAIAEANRIFGFDGWDRNVLEYKCVSERPRKIGREGRDGWSVSYVVHSRVRVGTVIRDGMGSGHGIDADLGLAHESAIKEAETDAMKRALMTFGNPFGLALYDKEQKQVADPVVVSIREEPAQDPVERCLAYINNAKNAKQLRKWWKETAEWRKTMGIVPNTENYETVYAALTLVGNELATLETKNG